MPRAKRGQGASLAAKHRAEKDAETAAAQAKTPARWPGRGRDRAEYQAYLLVQVPKPEITVSAEAKLIEAAGLD